MHIISPETDNCPSWISGRERMTVDNISWSISTKECCRPRRGLNPRPPGLQSDGASNWATEAGGSIWNNHYIVTDNEGYPSILFLISAQKHTLCTSLEAPWQDASNEYHNICFHAEIRKISVFFSYKNCLIWSYVITVTQRTDHDLVFYVPFNIIQVISSEGSKKRMTYF